MSVEKRAGTQSPRKKKSTSKGNTSTKARQQVPERNPLILLNIRIRGKVRGSALASMAGERGRGEVGAAMAKRETPSPRRGTLIVLNRRERGALPRRGGGGSEGNEFRAEKGGHLRTN